MKQCSPWMTLIGGNEGAKGRVSEGDGVSSLGTQLGDKAEGFEPDLPIFVWQPGISQQLKRGSRIWLARPKTVHICYLQQAGLYLESQTSLTV